MQDGSNERYWRIEYESSEKKSFSSSPRVSDTYFSKKMGKISMFHKNASRQQTKILNVVSGVTNDALSNATCPQNDFWPKTRVSGTC